MRISFSLFLLFVLGSTPLFSQEEGFEFVNAPITIVVLGSSTAAGAGTNPIDKAWVNRYRRYVQGFNPDNQVINLAKGGYNSYHLLPSGSYTPNRSKTDTLRNITKAMEFKPAGIIINLPSNDVSSGFSVKEQLDNFRTYQNYADSFGVELWITTTQARNFPKRSDRELQYDIKDSLEALFPNTCIDFWTGFSDENHIILKEYDSGDGCHMNNGAHKILTDRVIESQAFLWKFNESTFQRSTSIADQVELSPNLSEIGFKGQIEFDSSLSGKPRFVEIVQEGRVLNATEVANEKYDLTTVVDLRSPFELVFRGPNSLTKTVELNLVELIEDTDLPSNFYPIAALDMKEVALDKCTYQFPNSSFIVAKFHYDSVRYSLRLDKSYVDNQKQRLEDAMITPPAEGKKRVSHWENGNKKSVLKFKNGQLNGKCKWYTVDGTKNRVVTFKNGAYCGKYLVFNSKGKKKTKRKFEDDKQVGETKVY